jgi:hypothetical protein
LVGVVVGLYLLYCSKGTTLNQRVNQCSWILTSLFPSRFPPKNPWKNTGGVASGLWQLAKLRQEPDEGEVN